MSELIRCAGDILFDDNKPVPGLISNVQLKKFSETSNFLQYQRPLTPEHPYFFAQIRSLDLNVKFRPPSSTSCNGMVIAESGWKIKIEVKAQKSRITLGIAGPDIDNDAHPGHWNNTVGYHSDSGKCFTSHEDTANTKGEKFTIGDMLGVYVTYFGKNMSTVLFLKNGVPVATRYHYERDHSKFLPTICLEHGPIDIGLMWPEASMGVPRFDETNMVNWITGRNVEYDADRNEFQFIQSSLPGLLQSPRPLTQDMVHYEVIIGDNVSGESPSVGIATCSPIQPTPTCLLLRDFFRWRADGKSLKCDRGQRIGFGIHYSPERRTMPGFDDRAEQLVLCFVTLDMQIVFFRMMIQPTGGFYPLIALTETASSVTLDLETNRDLGDEETRELLDNLYMEKLEDARAVIEQDRLQRELAPSMLRQNGDIVIEPQDTKCVLRLPKNKKRIHAVQFKQPLTENQAYFYVEIVKLNEDSVISIGVGDSKFPLNKHPGKHSPSTGYVSKDGKMYYNQAYNGNIEGQRFGEGDTIGLEVRTFNPGGMSVVLFYKNNRPIGTRYVSIPEPDQFFPTVSLCGNGYDVELLVLWQNRISQPPEMQITKLDHWCLPEDSIVDDESNTIYVKNSTKPVSIQCPYSLDEHFNHFEISLVTEFGDGIRPPVVALCSACINEKFQTSHFRLDFLRFWAIGEAEKAVKLGDNVGWGMMVPPSEAEKEERMVICYLTINRNIALTYVMFEPTGGLFPLIVLPQEVNKVKVDLTAWRITSSPLTPERAENLLAEAKLIYRREQDFINAGNEFEDFQLDESSLLRPFVVENGDANEGPQSRTSPKLHGVVTQARAMDGIQRSIKSHREQQQQQGANSKACVIL